MVVQLAQLFVKNAKAIVSVSAGFILLILSHDFIAPLGPIVGIAGVLMIVASTSAELFSYLQQGISPLTFSLERSSDADVIKRLSRAEESIIAIQNNQSDARISTDLLSDSDKDELKERIFSHVSQREVKEYLSEIGKQVVNEQIQESAESLRRRYAGIVSALEQEISNLGRRANVNLVMGAAITTLGLIILGYFVLYASHPALSDRFETLLYFSTRLTLVVFIEVFAYFFLRLYRYSLFEIKYFQNESTNARFRIVGLEACIQNGRVEPSSRRSAWNWRKPKGTSFSKRVKRHFLLGRTT